MNWFGSTGSLGPYGSRGSATRRRCLAYLLSTLLANAHIRIGGNSLLRNIYQGERIDVSSVDDATSMAKRMLSSLSFGRGED